MNKKRQTYLQLQRKLGKQIRQQ